MTEKYCGQLGPRAEFACATDEVGVDVRLKNMRDRHLFFTREIKIAVHVSSRVNDCGNACGVIADQIRKLGEAFRVDAFKDEGHVLARFLM